MRPLLRRLGRGLRESREPLLVFAVTRGALFLLAYLSLAVLPLNSDPERRGAERRPLARVPDNLWLDGWARWDAGWYRHIATHGYVDQAVAPAGQRNLAFYPVYPLAMRLVSLGGLEPAGRRNPGLEPGVSRRAPAAPPDGARALRPRGGVPVRPAAVGLPLLLLLQRRLLGGPVPAPGRRRAVPGRAGALGRGVALRAPLRRHSRARGSPSRRRWASSTSSAIRFDLRKVRPDVLWLGLSVARALSSSTRTCRSSSATPGSRSGRRGCRAGGRGDSA